MLVQLATPWAINCKPYSLGGVDVPGKFEAGVPLMMQEAGAVFFGVRRRLERQTVPGQDEHVTGGDAAGDGYKFGDVYR